MKNLILIAAFIGFSYANSLSQAWTTIPSLFWHQYIPVDPDIAIDKNNNYWLTAYYGILEYNSSGVTHFFDSTFNGSGECITVDTNNIVWMGTTNDGVIRFDGVNFTRFDTANSTLADNRVTQIFADRNNRIWAYDQSSTLSVYDGVSWTSYNPSVTGINWYSQLTIDCDYNNNIYFGTLDTGIVKFDGTTWTSINTSNSNIAFNRVNDLHVAPDSSLWISSLQSFSMGLYMIGRYDGSSFTYYAPPLSVGAINPHQFCIDKNNIIWTLATANPFNFGIFKFDLSSWQFFKDPYGSAGIGFKMFMGTDGSAWTIDTWLISVFNENGFSNISGNVYNDLNGNGTKETGETGVPYFKVEIPGYSYALTDLQGDYHVMFYDSSLTYPVQLGTVNYWQQTSVPASYSVTPLTDALTGYDFGVHQTANVNDLSISVSNFPLRPGWNVPFWINVQNNGSNAMNDTVTFTYDPSLTFIASSIPPDYSNGNILKWYGTSGPGMLSTVQVVLQVSASATIGDTVYFSATADPVWNDATPADNTYNYECIISGPYDPNCKTVFPAENISPDQWLNYTVCFQNTGMDTAFNVILYDTLHVNLDVTTFEVTGSSHPVNYTLNGSGNLAFKFLNIQLPDSNINEPASHGFVSYRIKPQPGLMNGTQILNIAGIAFDYNSIIMTNQTLNTIDNALGISEPEFYPEEVILYPNPASSVFNISVNVPDKMMHEFIISDLNGRRITSVKKILPKGKNIVQMNTDILNRGLYLITIKSEFDITYLSVVVN